MPSRRQVLRGSALSFSFSAFSGCATSEGTTTGPPPTRTTRETTESPTGTGTETATPSPLRCGPGPLPAEGWPRVARSVGRTNFAPDAGGPTSDPTAEWTVTVPDPETGWVRLTRPVVADGRVYTSRRVRVGTEQPEPDEQYVYAHDAATGDQQWRASVSGLPSTPGFADGQLFVHDESTLYALDAATGEQNWTHSPEGGVDCILPTPESVLLTASRAEASDRVLALTSDGRLGWRVTVPSYVYNSDLARVGGRVYLVTSEAVLVAIDRRTIAWKRGLQTGEDRGPAALVATPCAVFVAVDDTLYAVGRDGELAWSVDAGVRQLATDGETVYGLDDSGYARAFAVADGAKRWEQFYGIEDSQQTDGFYVDPAVDGGTLYAGTLDGNLLAMSRSDGSERWSVERDWNEQATVSVVEGTLYTAWGRHLVAFR